ncbi:MAG: NTP transferase domain-containing protein [Armatimonadota bacterium]|nr:MAG: NTP transferase domain-containing protein [Armatimonadota bacterium]
MPPDGKLHVVIMAGGTGTRLWPISRRSRPKQFQPLLSDQTMLLDTYKRVRPLTAPQRVWVVTNAEHVSIARSQLPKVPPQNVLGEPMGRSSAPAVALAAARIARTDPEAVVVATPVDSYIGDAVAYRDYIATAVETAQERFIVVLGVMPSHPETGYGYVQRGKRLKRPLSGAYRVERFTEKPDEHKAERYLAHGGYYWNMGQFIFRADHFMDRCAAHLPEVADGVRKLAKSDEPPAELIEQVYRDLPSISMDYGIAEREEDMAVVPTALEWSDLGHWRSIKDIARRRGLPEAHPENHIAVRSPDCFVVADSGRLIVTVGVEGYIIVDTDDALLVVREENAQDVRDALDEIQRSGKEQHL